MFIDTYYKPTNNGVFQLLFGKNKNKHLTDIFIKSILKHENENLEGLNNLNVTSEFPLEKSYVEEKWGRLDIIAEYDSAIVCIEMQNKKEADFYQRSRCYAHKISAMQLNAGQNYLDLKPIIMINILNYKSDSCYTKDYMEHIITVNKYFRDIDVKMGIKFIFIFLKDVKNIDIFNPDNEYIHWLKFIKFDNKEVIDMVNTMNKNTKLATDELDKINAEEEARNYARMREFDELDRRLEYSAGVDAGRIEGKIAEKLEMAKEMLKHKYSISEIKALTKLSESEILQLKETA